jgi:tripartite-type tricarboxylate transporter receptor subunit TctC
MKRCVSMKLVLLGLALTVTLAVTLPANAQPGTFVKGVLQPLADGFPKQAITIINVDDPGTRDGIYARAFQTALRGISPVPILVSDEPAPVGGTWYKVKEVIDRRGGTDGYYPIVISCVGATTDLLTDLATEEMGVKLDDLNMVIVTDTFPWLMIQRKNAPWGKTFAAMVKYAKENPGKLKYISNEIGSGHDIATEWIIQTFGLKVTKIPAGSIQEAASVIGAGEGDFTLTRMDTGFANWQAGRVDVTIVMPGRIVPPWDKDPNVVTAEQAGLPSLGGPAGTILGLAVPRQVSQAHVDWLFKLFEAATSTDSYRKREQQIPGLVINVVDGAKANAINKNIYEASDPIVRSIGIHIDQQK